MDNVIIAVFTLLLATNNDDGTTTGRGLEGQDGADAKQELASSSTSTTRHAELCLFVLVLPPSAFLLVTNNKKGLVPFGVGGIFSSFTVLLLLVAIALMVALL